MFCEKCGTNNPDDSSFCIKCGASLGGAPAAAQPAQQPQPVQAPAPAPAPAYAAGAQPRQAVSYGPAPTNQEPLTMGNYLVMLLLSAIPTVGFILLLVWAFGSNVNLNKRNYARAALIMALIAAGIAIVIFLFGLIIGNSVFSSNY